MNNGNQIEEGTKTLPEEGTIWALDGIIGEPADIQSGELCVEGKGTKEWRSGR